MDSEAYIKSTIEQLKQRKVVLVFGKGTVPDDECKAADYLVEAAIIANRYHLMPEFTYRLGRGILRSAFDQLREREQNAHVPFAVGTVTTPEELTDVIDSTADMIVSPESTLYDLKSGQHLIQQAREQGKLYVPAVASPKEFNSLFVRDDDIAAPDVVKVFRDNTPSNILEFLPPFDKEPYNGRVIMLAGGISIYNARQFVDSLSGVTFDPIFAMVDPFKFMGPKGVGDIKSLERSLIVFNNQLYYEPTGIRANPLAQ